MEPIFTVHNHAYEFGILEFNIEYSAGEHENELEYECTKVSETNNLSPEDVCKVEKYLENGLEEYIMHQLIDKYKNTSIKFIPNHYEVL